MRKSKRKSIAVAVILLVLLLAIYLAMWFANKPKLITVTGDTAIIRLPGEFEGEANVKYNSKYTEQSVTDSILTLKFKKPGYYKCFIGFKVYIFEVLDFDETNYTVDLITKEYRSIMHTVYLEKLLIAFAIWLVCILVFTQIIPRKITKKAKKEKLSFEEDNFKLT